MKSILLIEDDQVDARAFCRTVEDEYLVFCATTMYAAKQVLLDNPQISAIVMDYHLPGISGIPALKELVAIAHGIPIIVLTGAKDISKQLKAADLEVADCIWKGVSKKWVLNSVNRALQWSDIETRLQKYGIECG